MNLSMPRLSDTMEEGTLGRWLKQEGEVIQKGDVIAEIQTDKANMELEAFQTGVLERILVQEGETVPVGDPIAVIGSGDGSPTSQGAPRQAEPAPATQTPEPTQSPQAVSPQQAPASTSRQGGRIKASPLARRLAQELGVDLAQLRGTGPNGRIDRDDVQKAARSAPPVQSPVTEAPAVTHAPPVATSAQPTVTVGETRRLSRMENIIAQRMLQSKTQVPHFYVTAELNMKKAIALREELNALGGQKISFNDMIVRACALVLGSNARANGSFVEGGIRSNPQVNVGFAVTIEGGLVVPVVRDADKKSLRQIAAESRDLIAKARDNKLSTEELSGGTFTVSNLGMYGVDEFIAIINQPESAILAVGAITEQPVVEGGQIVVGHRMRVTLSSDHRILYGSHAAEFLQQLRRLLENPLELGF